jgi:two-component system, NtrC family, response regulator AtoC
MLLAKNNLITSQEVPLEFKAALDKIITAPADDGKKPFKDYMRDHVENVERQMIIKCLEESGGNVTNAAKQLGLSRKGLQLKMIKYNLRKESK